MARRTPRQNSTAQGLKPRRRALPAELARLEPLVRRLAALQQQACELGLFVHDRELITCLGCGLTEDVTIEGRLITYTPARPHQDTGLRFAAMDRASEKFQCPMCGSEAIPDPEPVVD